MRHWKARRRLAALLDGLLPGSEEREVRAHVARCRSCARTLRELELSAALVRRMPPDLVPAEWSLAAETRLEAVGSPVGRGRLSAPDALALRAVVAAATVAFLFVMVSVGPWSARRQEPRQHSGMLATAEREATILAMAFEPRAEVASN